MTILKKLSVSQILELIFELSFIRLIFFVVNPEVKVWLTVSSLAGFDKKLNQPFERQLELNWRRAPTHSTQLWVGLFNEEPKEEKLVKKGKNYSIEWFETQRESTGSQRYSYSFL